MKFLMVLIIFISCVMILTSHMSVNAEHNEKTRKKHSSDYLQEALEREAKIAKRKNPQIFDWCSGPTCEMNKQQYREDKEKVKFLLNICRDAESKFEKKYCIDELKKIQKSPWVFLEKPEIKKIIKSFSAELEIKDTDTKKNKKSDGTKKDVKSK